MSEILSQSEMGDLFKSLNEKELNEGKAKQKSNKNVVKPYDFTRPTKFSKEQLKTLENIFENYGRLVSTYLSGYLHTLASVDVLGSEAMSYSEFTNLLSNPVMLAIIDFMPLEGAVIIEMSPNIGYGIIDRVLGGKGSLMGRLREFTDIEHIILKKIFEQITQLLVEPWGNVLELDPELKKIETSSQVIQFVAPNEMVARITLNIKLGEIEGNMNICIPYLVIEPIIEKLNTKYWFNNSEHKHDQINEAQIKRMVESTPIPIKAVLGKTHITIQEFLGLQSMDIIKLDKGIDEDVDIYIGNIKKFTAKPGIHKNKVAVKINNVITREDE